jgi:Predicted membrane protein (DUF2154).
MTRKTDRRDTIIFGVLVLLAGVLLFAFNAGWLPFVYKHVIFSWPFLLVVCGICCFFAKKHWWLGTTLILIGGFFLLPRFQIADLGFIARNKWPIILSIGGLLIIAKTLFWPQHYAEGFCVKVNNNGASNKGKYRGMPGYIDRTYTFSGCEEKFSHSAFKGGEINCVFGGMELDLSDSTLAEGSHTLEINAVFGGCVLYLPPSWKVEVHPSSTFGKFTDSRPKASFEVDEKSLLIIKTNAVFGGGEIKCK